MVDLNAFLKFICWCTNIGSSLYTNSKEYSINLVVLLLFLFEIQNIIDFNQSFRRKDNLVFVCG